MEIGFGAETDRLRAYKQAGINREVTIGVPRFDQQVYIRTHTPDDTVRAILADEALRSAIVDMLHEEPGEFMLDHPRRGGRLLVSLTSSDQPQSPGRAAKIVDRLTAVYARLPAIEETGTLAERWSRLKAMGVVALCCLPGGVLCAFRMLEAIIGGTRTALSWWRAVAIGVAAGGVLAVPVCLAIFHKVRGEFHSATRQRLMMIASTIVLMQFATLVAHWFRY